MQVTTTPPAPQPTETAPSPGVPTAQSAELTQFLGLLTAQVQNQDPLEPLDATAFTEQLATFSALEQQVRTNDLLAEVLAVLREGEAGGG